MTPDQANRDSVRHAKRLLDDLRPVCFAPDVGVDPDGSVSLEWFASPECLFSVSVAASGELHYAGRFGKSRVRGKETNATAAAELLRWYVERVKD